MFRELILVSTDLIESSNCKIRKYSVDMLVRMKIKISNCGAFPAYFHPELKRFIITDGNHRLEALKQRGYKFAPLVEITKEEFDTVKFSKRSIDLIVQVPERIRVIKTNEQISQGLE